MKSLLLLGVGFMYILVQVSMFFPQSVSAAASDKDIARYSSYIQWAQDDSPCHPNNGNYYPVVLLTTDYNDDNYYLEPNSQSFSVSRTIDSLIGDGTNQSLSCDGVFRDIVRTVWGSRKAFLQEYYDTSKPFDGQGGDGDYYNSFQCKKDGSCGPDQARAIAKSIVSKVKAWAADVKKGNDADFLAWEKAETLVAFKGCWKYNADKDPANYPTADSKDGAKKYDKDYYNRVAKSDISVGYLTEVYIDGGHDNGKASCDNVFDKVKKLKLLDDKSVKQPVDTEDGSGGLSGDADPATCDGGSFDWVICPLVDAAANAADAIVDNFLQPVLRAQILNLPGQGNDASNALYNVWRGFRDIANAALVISFLVIIISTAMSSE
jgi:hypothetical protein